MSDRVVPPGEMEIVPAAGAADMATIRRLFREYQAWLGVDLCFQDFDAELAGLPGFYAPPDGGLWLAHAEGGALAGCVGLKPLKRGVAEMKRLWVRKPYRGAGLGRRLAGTCVEAARASGYRCVRLDTLAHLTASHGLYRSMGFREIAPYYHNPLAGVRYMELDLSR